MKRRTFDILAAAGGLFLAVTPVAGDRRAREHT